MAQISMLLHDEHLPFCTSKIDEIYCEFEPQKARAIINGALDEFAIRLSVLECAGKQNKRCAVRKAVDAFDEHRTSNWTGQLNQCGPQCARLNR